MSLPEIEACREKMVKSTEYGDIAETVTSAGTMFLYSTQYMPSAHAEYLAEWLDRGQSENP